MDPSASVKTLKEKKGSNKLTPHLSVFILIYVIKSKKKCSYFIFQALTLSFRVELMQGQGIVKTLEEIALFPPMNFTHEGNKLLFTRV